MVSPLLHSKQRLQPYVQYETSLKPIVFSRHFFPDLLMIVKNLNKEAIKCPWQIFDTSHTTNFNILTPFVVIVRTSKNFCEVAIHEKSTFINTRIKFHLMKLCYIVSVRFFDDIYNPGNICVSLCPVWSNFLLAKLLNKLK